jgi:hypothetical protein
MPASWPQLLRLRQDGKPAHVQIYRVEWMPVLEVPRGKLVPGSTPETQLGIGSWSISRDWRAAGSSDTT